MRSVSRAICTSGEPVSPSWVRNCSIKLFLRSSVSGIGGSSNRHASEMPPQGGFQKTFFCQQIREEVTTVSLPSKGTGSEPETRLLRIRLDLSAERLDGGKPAFFPYPRHEGERHGLTIDVAREIEKICLDGQCGLAKGRTDADVDDRALLPAGELGSTGIDAGRD